MTPSTNHLSPSLSTIVLAGVNSHSAREPYVYVYDNSSTGLTRAAA